MDYSGILIGAVLTILTGGVVNWLNHQSRVRSDRLEEERRERRESERQASAMGTELFASAREVHRQYLALHGLAPNIRTEQLILEFIPVIEAYASFSARVNAMNTAGLKPHQVRALEGFKTYTCWVFLLMSTDSDTRRSAERQNQVAEALNHMAHLLEVYQSADGDELPTAPPATVH